MNEALTEFNIKFKIDNLKIYETDGWVWSLRPHQATLGSSILSLKRPCKNFSDLTQDEHCDLSKMIKVIEPTLKELLNYDVINYVMLMMFDKQVHFHVIPRYEQEREFLGTVWKDEAWPGIPSLAGEALAIEKLNKFAQHVKENLKF